MWLVAVKFNKLIVDFDQIVPNCADDENSSVWNSIQDVSTTEEIFGIFPFKLTSIKSPLGLCQISIPI